MIGAIVAVAGAAYDINEKRKAGNEVDRRGGEAAELEDQLTREELRRMDLEQAQRVGTVEAQLGGSGVRGVGRGSAATALRSMEEQYELDRAWTEEAGASEAAKLRSQGASAKNLTRTGMTSDALSAFSSIGDANDWWT